MKKTILIVFTFIAVSFTSPIYSQDYILDMKKVYAAYSSLNNFYSEIQIKIFSDENSESAIYTKGGVMKKFNENFLSDIDGIMTLTNKEVTLVKNRAMKEISFSLKDTSSAQSMLYNLESMMIDSSMSHVDSIVYVGLKKGRKCYFVYNSLSIISRAEIEIDPVSYFIIRVTYHYQKSSSIAYSKVEIAYNNIDVNKSFSSNEFRTESYIQIIGNNVKAVAPNEDYEVIFIDSSGESLDF